MKITSLEAIPFRIPLLAPVKWGLAGYMEAAEHVLVMVHTDEGITGVAEAPARPSIYGESVVSITYAVKNWFEPMVKGLDPAHHEKFSVLLERIPANQTAKGAIDLACYDAVARLRGVPLWEMLGGSGDTVRLSWMLALRPVAEMVSEAESFRAKGINAFKVKVGLDPQKDIQVIKSMRENLGDDVLLYADANMAYEDSNVAIRTIQKMQEYGLAFIEEPLPIWNRRGRLKLAQAISIPILGDESVFSPQDVAREIELGAIGMISIKTPRTGYTNSLKIAHLAEISGLSCLMGTQGESGVGTLASAQFGAARRVVSHPSEISFFLFMKDDLLAEPVPLKDGCIVLPELPGNGAILDKDKLAKYRMD
jgi:L-alanine-DL-glutamate epimerase-like enolase superfamily enzyme